MLPVNELPSCKEVTFYTERDLNGIHISYTFQQYRGHDGYFYNRTHLKSGREFPQEIYGVTIDQLKRLIAKWNTLQPSLWKYELIGIK